MGLLESPTKVLNMPRFYLVSSSFSAIAARIFLFSSSNIILMSTYKIYPLSSPNIWSRVVNKSIFNHVQSVSPTCSSPNCNLWFKRFIEAYLLNWAQCNQGTFKINCSLVHSKVACRCRVHGEWDDGFPGLRHFPASAGCQAVPRGGASSSSCQLGHSAERVQPLVSSPARPLRDSTTMGKNAIPSLL